MKRARVPSSLNYSGGKLKAVGPRQTAYTDSSQNGYGHNDDFDPDDHDDVADDDKKLWAWTYIGIYT